MDLERREREKDKDKEGGFEREGRFYIEGQILKVLINLDRRKRRF